MMFGGRRHFRELLRNSEEGISSNILADRLRMLMEEGMITKADDASHSQKAIYSLTDKSIGLLPVFVQLGAWGRRYLPITEQMGIRGQLLEEGGQELWERFMAELREDHLRPPKTRGGSMVAEELQTAFEQARLRETGR